MNRATKKVFGFIFDTTLRTVLLGDYKNGMNGISTKVRKDELPMDALMRAVRDKTLVEPTKLIWKHYASIIRNNSVDYYYWAIADSLLPKEESGVTTVTTQYISNLNTNAKWLIPMAQKEISNVDFPFILVENDVET